MFCGVFKLREFITQLRCAIRFSFKLEQFSLKNDRKSVSQTPTKHQKSNAERDIPSKTAPEVRKTSWGSIHFQFESIHFQFESIHFRLKSIHFQRRETRNLWGALGKGRGGEATLDSLLTQYKTNSYPTLHQFIPFWNPSEQPHRFVGKPLGRLRDLKKRPSSTRQPWEALKPSSLQAYKGRGGMREAKTITLAWP